MFRRLLRWRVGRQYRRHREALLARFLDALQQSGQPEGLRWKSIVPSGDATVVEQADDLTFLQPVEVKFDAIVGGGMEDAPALASVRAAIAMLHWSDGSWTTGRCLFNIDVDEVAAKLRDVDDDSPHSTD